MAVAAAIIMPAALSLVSAKAACFGVLYLLCGVAKVVEKVLERERPRKG